MFDSIAKWLPVMTTLAIMATGCGAAVEDEGGDFEQRQQAMCSGSQLYGINIDPANPAGNPSPDTLADYGVTWVRIEYKAHQGFAFYDDIIAALRARGIRVMMIVDYASVMTASAPGAGGSDDAWSSYINGHFSASVQLAAEHYGDSVDAWQIWNEQDLNNGDPHYDVYIPPRHYATMLRMASETINSYSTSPIVTGGFASGQPAYVDQVKGALGGDFDRLVDVVAVHPYGQCTAQDYEMGHGWCLGRVDNLIGAYAAHGKPIWISEIGINTPDDDNGQTMQANYLRNIYSFAASSSAVERVFWFCWSDGMVDDFGITFPDQTDKLSGLAYKEVSGQCGGGDPLDTDIQDPPEQPELPPIDEQPPAAQPPAEQPPAAQPEAFSCAAGGERDNLCHWPPNTPGLPETAPGGLCDPNGDGSYDDADWGRGYNLYRDRCAGVSVEQPAAQPAAEQSPTLNQPHAVSGCNQAPGAPIDPSLALLGLAGLVGLARRRAA